MNPMEWITYNTNYQIKFTTSVVRSSLCDYSDAYILVSGFIKVSKTAEAAAVAAGNNGTNIIFKFHSIY